MRRDIALALVFAAGVASAEKKGEATPVPGPVTFSCPKGWEQEGEECLRRGSVKPITTTNPVFTEVPADNNCPKGYEFAGKQCARQEYAKKIPQQEQEQVPEKFCPPGTTQSGKKGEITCTVTKSLTRHEQLEAPKQVNTQRAAKVPYPVTVNQPSAVLSHVCPPGTTPTDGTKKEGPTTCAVKNTLANYEMYEVPKELRIPHEEKVFSKYCPPGTRSQGSGDNLTCIADVSSQVVKMKSIEKPIKVPQLKEMPRTVPLTKTVKVSREICPPGSVNKALSPIHGAGGSAALERAGPSEGAAQGAPGSLRCVVTTTRQQVKEVRTPKDVELPTVVKRSQTHRLVATHLEVQSSPPGAMKSMRKTAITKVVERPKKVNVGRTVKTPKTVKVAKVVSVPEEYCPKGSTPDTSGQKGPGLVCVVQGTIQVPYTVETPVKVCPPGSTEEQGECVIKSTEYVPAEEVPLPGKGKGKKGPQGVTQVCPKGSTPQGTPETGLVCIINKFQTVPHEELKTSKIAYKTESVKDIVPALVQYKSQTAYEEAQTEEVHVENEHVEVIETETVLETQEYEEEMPPNLNVKSVPMPTEETVPIQLVCIPGIGLPPRTGAPSAMQGLQSEAQASEAEWETTSYEAGPSSTVSLGSTSAGFVPAGSITSSAMRGAPSGARGAAPTSAAARSKVCKKDLVYETHYEVENVTEEEEVPAVLAWSTAPETDSASVTEAKLEYVPSTLTETTSYVETIPGTEIVPAAERVTFKPAPQPLTVSEKRVRTISNPQIDYVPALPTYQSVSRPEQHITAALKFENVPVILNEASIKTSTETVTEEVPAQTRLKAVPRTNYVCPPGYTEGGEGKKGECVKTVTAPIETTCPPGTQLKHGACVKTSSETQTACPPGSVQSEAGKGCEIIERIPATINYPAPEITEAPAPMKKVSPAPAPAPRKKY